MGVGDLLDQAIRLYRRNFVTLVSIVAIIHVPLLLVQVAAAALTLPWNLNGANSPLIGDGSLGPALLVVASLVVGLLAAFGTIFEIGALSVFISESYLGRTVTVWQAYGRALRRWLSLFIAVILVGLAISPLVGLVFVPFLALGLIPALAASGSTSDTFAAVGGLVSLCACLLVLPVILGVTYLLVKWLFYIQAIVLEDFNSTGGLGRSWRLVKGKFWRTLGFYLIVLIIGAAFTTGPTYLLMAGILLMPSPLLITLVPTVAQNLLQILVAPIQFAALTLYYYDLRVRQEGLDLQLQLEQPVPPPSPNLLRPTF
jgi:hypothetical protein